MNEDLLKLIREFKGIVRFSWVEDQCAYLVVVEKNSYRYSLWVAQRSVEQSVFDLLLYEIQKAVRYVNDHIGVVESVNPDGTATVKLDSPNETWRNRPAML